MRTFTFFLGLVVLTGQVVFAHCQIPCGIYDDDLRFSLMLEHVTTIRKSTAEIKKISEADEPDENQLVRWVVNKEDHAGKIQEIITQYFLAQRIKESQTGYEKMLVQVHRIMVYAMKTKQSLAPENADQLETAILELKKLYAKRDS